jgi:PAS domain S-box-containing protein
MPEIGHHNTLEEVQSAPFKIGAQATFIFICGFILSLAILFGMQQLTADMRATDARNATRDVFQEAERCIKNITDTVELLSSHFSTLSEPYAITTYQTQKILFSPTGQMPFDVVVWGPEKGSWHYLDYRVGKETLTPDGPIKGWPDYKILGELSYGIDDQSLIYLSEIPGQIFKSVPVADPAKKPMGILAHSRAADGRHGFILSITTAEKIFANIIPSQRSDIYAVYIEDRETGQTVFRRQLSDANDVSSGTIETVTDVLQIGDRYMALNIEIFQTPVARLLKITPYVLAFIIFFLTVGAAAISERKLRQDQKIEEMSQSLLGAQDEIKSKISERDNLFYALRQSEREYRSMINSVSEVIFETDQSGKIIYLNETWKRIMQVDVEATIGKSLFLMIDPADQMQQKEMFEELVKGIRQAYRIETRINTVGTIYKPVEIAFSMIRMAEDKTLRVVGTISDIEKRRKAEMALREAEQKFRAIFENSVSGIYQITPTGKIVRANTALAELLGYATPEELIMSITNVGPQLYVRPEERKQFEQKILFEGRVSGMETELIRKDGRRIWVMENARAVRSEKGTVDYFEGSLWDITTRKEADEAMRQARLQAEISSRSRMEFLANMSHELRTPLNAVIGFAEIIKDEIMGPLNVPVYKEYARDIYDSGNGLLKIISEILEVSKIETGNRELNVSNFKILKAIKACVVIMQSRIDESGVSVKLDVPDHLPDVLGEELAFKQIMLNLLSNAIKFTPKEGQVRIVARVTDDGEMYIDVVDNGIGMTPEEIKKAMQPFGKVDTTFSTMKSGTGLGLTIVESLVRLHGGRFEIISEKDVGTTARVVLPEFRVLRKETAQSAAS